MFDNEIQEYGAEEDIVALKEVTSSYLRRMVGQEGCPGLSGVSRWCLASSLAHIAADRTPIDLQTKFQ